jgi:hypothetical protein
VAAMFASVNATLCDRCGMRAHQRAHTDARAHHSNGVLHEPIEHLTANGGDQLLFKGIYARYVRYVLDVMPARTRARMQSFLRIQVPCTNSHPLVSPAPTQAESILMHDRNTSSSELLFGSVR